MGTGCRVGVLGSEKNIFPTPMLLHAFSKEVVRQARRRRTRESIHSTSHKLDQYQGARMVGGWVLAEEFRYTVGGRRIHHKVSCWRCDNARCGPEWH